jgi:hypothetical protein
VSGLIKIFFKSHLKVTHVKDAWILLASLSPKKGEVVVQPLLPIGKFF